MMPVFAREQDVAAARVEDPPWLVDVQLVTFLRDNIVMPDT